MDKLLTTKSKPAKPAKPAKPEKPVAKPRLKPKPDLKPKPTPKPRFAEAGAGEEELFGGGVPTAKPRKLEKPPVPKKKPTGGDEDLFVHARKQSFNRFVSMIFFCGGAAVMAMYFPPKSGNRPFLKNIQILVDTIPQY